MSVRNSTGIPLSRKLFWKCRERLFESHDYFLPDSMLPRAWLGLGGSSTPLCHPNGIEAYHLATNRFVYIKKTSTRGMDLAMLLHLKLQESHLIPMNSLREVLDVFEDEDDTQEWQEMRERIKPYRFTDEMDRMPTRNPVPELLDVFLDDEDETIAYVVMPLLRSIGDVLHSFDDTFQTIGDVVEFGVQLLEEVHFLNKEMFYHQAIDETVVLMDSNRTPYIVDYSQSLSNPEFYARYPHVIKLTPDYTLSEKDEYREMDLREDVRSAGRVMMLFLNRYSNLEFLRPLLERMIHQTYTNRLEPSAALHKMIKLRDGNMTKVRLAMPLLERENRLWKNIKISAKGLFKSKKVVPNY